MNDVRRGRFSLFVAIVGLLAMGATLFVSPIVVMFVVFGGVALLAGLMGARTNAARIGLFLAVVALPIVTLVSHLCAPNTVAANVSVRFSPNGGCTDAIIAQIANAKRTVHVQAYSFTSPPIAKALVAAHRRGVAVRVVLDKSQQTAKYSSATFLQNNGIAPQIDHQHKIAHNKIIVVDSAIVITGSMNFSKAAEKDNAENVVFLRDGGLAARYLENFRAHAGHSLPYVPPGEQGEWSFADTAHDTETHEEE